ncbi:helix-turn-helix domain-containing protein [Alicyclobacillus fodiniaquatilis]|uniref:Helix-turn-helix domain-containing protein n=1 Tax=Alicyclobacillus fodiniaquatilis TaxID=1661150 RepID=A0ABW4JDH5_9BACL
MNEQGQVRKGWTNGYFTVPNGIYEMQIGGHAKAVYVYLCRRADSEGQSFPGYGTIAGEVGFSRSTVQRAVNELINAGLLLKEVRGRKENGEFYPNLYTVIHPLDVIPKRVWSDRPHPPKGMVTENTPMVSETIPMVTENIPMVCENKEGILIKDYPLTKPIKDTPTQEAFTVIQEISATIERSEEPTEVKKQNEHVCKEIQSVLEEKGIQVQAKTIRAWLQIAKPDDVLYAAELATKEGVRNPAGFIGSLIRNGIVRVEATTTNKTSNAKDKRYTAFYKLFPEN